MNAFSIAEVAIALLIGSVVLGMSAPMISKQLQHNTLNDIKSRILKGEIEKVESKANTNIVNIKTHDGKILDIQKQLAELQAALAAIETINYDDEISALESKLSSKADSSSVTKISNSLTTLEGDVDDLSDDVTDLEKDMKKLVPKGAIMFFNLTSCPDGWSAITNMGGRYPRIATYKDGKLADAINSTKEQMVHRHKHVSPLIVAASSGRSQANTFRYGPYRAAYTKFYPSGDTDGKYSYPDFNFYRAGTSYKVYASGAGQGLTSGGLASPDNNNWYAYTSDGMNRVEIIGGASDSAYTILTCPNKDENDAVCKKTGNKLQYTDSGGKSMVMTFNNTHYDYMPLVGTENRPNSVIWLACQKK